MTRREASLKERFALRLKAARLLLSPDLSDAAADALARALVEAAKALPCDDTFGGFGAFEALADLTMTANQAALDEALS